MRWASINGRLHNLFNFLVHECLRKDTIRCSNSFLLSSAVIEIILNGHSLQLQFNYKHCLKMSKDNWIWQLPSLINYNFKGNFPESFLRRFYVLVFHAADIQEYRKVFHFKRLAAVAGDDSSKIVVKRKQARDLCSVTIFCSTEYNAAADDSWKGIAPCLRELRSLLRAMSSLDFYLQAIATDGMEEMQESEGIEERLTAQDTETTSDNLPAEFFPNLQLWNRSLGLTFES